MNVLVIPENPKNDEHILQPIIAKIFERLGKTATVRVCKDPVLGGLGEALKWARILEILDRYKGMNKIFVLCVDRDGDENRKNRLNELEKKAAEELGSGKVFFAENAWQEIEAWVLAGLDLPKEWNWPQIRQEVNPKETYFEPYARQENLSKTPGGGRKLLTQKAISRFEGMLGKCPEDLKNLYDRIEDWLSTQTEN